MSSSIVPQQSTTANPTPIAPPLDLDAAIAAIHKSKLAAEQIAQTITDDQAAATAEHAKADALDQTVATDKDVQGADNALLIADLMAGKAAIDAVLQSLQPVPVPAGAKP